jgi:drug/metabolite transporter (DMT)-like permease
LTASSKKPSSALIYALVGLMIVIWSFNFVVTKTVSAYLDGPFLACIRTVIAGLCILPIYWRGPAFTGTREELWKLIGLGAAGIAFNQILFVVGLGLTSVAHGAIITALAPVQVLLLAVFVKQEHLNVRKAAGVILAFGGVAWLQLGKSNNAGATLFGDFLMYLGTLFFAFFSVFGKSYTKRLGSLTVTGIGFISAAVVAAPFAWYAGRDLPLAQVPALAWVGLAYMAIFSSVVGYLIFNYALAHVPASRVAAFLYTQPIVATLMGWAFLSEQLTVSLGISTALVLLGLWVVESGR